MLTTWEDMHRRFHCHVGPDLRRARVDRYTWRDMSGAREEKWETLYFIYLYLFFLQEKGKKNILKRAYPLSH